MKNNLFIGVLNHSTWFPHICFNEANYSCGYVAEVIYQNNKVITPTEANDLGLMKENFYKPPTVINLLDSMGVNLNSLFSVDILGRIRPVSGAWDVGPYEGP